MSPHSCQWLTCRKVPSLIQVAAACRQQAVECHHNGGKAAEHTGKHASDGMAILTGFSWPLCHPPHRRLNVGSPTKFIQTATVDAIVSQSPLQQLHRTPAVVGGTFITFDTCTVLPASKIRSAWNLSLRKTRNSGNSGPVWNSDIHFTSILEYILQSRLQISKCPPCLVVFKCS